MNTTSTLAMSRSYRRQPNKAWCIRTAIFRLVRAAEQGTTSATGNPKATFVPVGFSRLYTCSGRDGTVLWVNLSRGDVRCRPALHTIEDLLRFRTAQRVSSSMVSVRKSLRVVDPGGCWPAQRRGASDAVRHVVRTQRDVHLFGHYQAAPLTFPSVQNFVLGCPLTRSSRPSRHWSGSLGSGRPVSGAAGVA